ncbi:MAG: M50 family metallopeptidase [Bacillota bacterium]
MALIAVYLGLGYGTQVLLVCLALAGHELAHICAARLNSLDVELLELLPCGGMAEIPGLTGADPYEETFVAAAGPASSLTWGGLAWVLTDSGLLAAELGYTFALLNLSIGLFNLLPALPLDGGHIVRAYLSRRLGRGPATTLTARAGRVLGACLGAAGLIALVYGSPWPSLFVLGYFIYTAAGRERAMVLWQGMRRLAEKQGVLITGEALPGSVLVTSERATVGAVLNRLSSRYYSIVVITDAGRSPVALCTEADLLDAMRRGGFDLPIGDCLRSK